VTRSNHYRLEQSASQMITKTQKITYCYWQ